jgi:hypothetical protein
MRTMAGALIALVLLVAAPAAGAEVLLEQQPGPAAAGIPSYRSDPEHFSEAADDFFVPGGGHWQLSTLRIPGGALAGHRFQVTVYASNLTSNEAGESWAMPERPPPTVGPPFEARGVTATGDALPLVGVPLLEGGRKYWVSVVAEEAPGAPEPWRWPTAPGTDDPASIREPNGVCGFFGPRPRCPTAPGGEPGQALILEGTREQLLSTGAGGFGATGRVESLAAGISCPRTCNTALPLGTVVTLTAVPDGPYADVIDWSGGTLPAGGTLPSRPVDPATLPCMADGPSCTFTLDHDITLDAFFYPWDPFIFEDVDRFPRAGTAALEITLVTPGRLSLTGTGIREWSSAGPTSGARRVPIRPTAAVRRLLRRNGSAKVDVHLGYRPALGVERTLDRKLTLHLKPRHPRRHRSG